MGDDDLSVVVDDVDAEASDIEVKDDVAVARDSEVVDVEAAVDVEVDNDVEAAVDDVGGLPPTDADAIDGLVWVFTWLFELLLSSFVMSSPPKITRLGVGVLRKLFIGPPNLKMDGDCCGAGAGGWSGLCSRMMLVSTRSQPSISCSEDAHA